MDKYEITNEQYCAYLNVALLLEEIVVSDNGFYVFGFEGEYDGQRYLQMSHLGHEYTRWWIEFDGTRFYVVPGHEDWPVVYVTWVGSKMFALSWGCDLPTEAEWEYAARSGEQFLYATDDGTLDDTKANYNYNVGNVASVGIYPANQFGLYDMSGNVWEWCSDFYGEYSSENMFDPIGPLDGKETILRGGCWSTTYITHCRTARRAKTATLMLNDHFGFRVVQRIGNITY